MQPDRGRRWRPGRKRARKDLRLRFAHMDIAFEATGRRLDDGSATVRIEADLAPLPHSMEAPGLRRRVLAVLHGARLVASLFALTRDQRIPLRADAAVAGPVTPASVLTAIARLVVGARPFLDLLVERLNATGEAA